MIGLCLEPFTFAYDAEYLVLFTRVDADGRVRDQNLELRCWAACHHRWSVGVNSRTKVSLNRLCSLAIIDAAKNKTTAR